MAGAGVSLVDLDLVNPYFRAREARQMLDALGHRHYPAPRTSAAGRLTDSGASGGRMYRLPQDLRILDVGGDDAGATVLAALSDVFKDMDGPMEMLQVVNPYRPNTDSVEGCLRIKAAIESSSRLTVSGWIGNANLIEETTVGQISFGAEFMASLSGASGLAVKFITAPHALLADARAMQLPWPVLPVQRQLVPPWARAAKMQAG